MKRSFPRLRHLINRRKRSSTTRQQLIITVAIFVLIGGLILLISRAATGQVSLFASRGTLSGNAQSVTDATAAGGTAVQFGSSGNPQPSFVLPLQRQVVTGQINVAALVANHVNGQPVELWYNDIVKLGTMTNTPPFGWILAVDTAKLGNGTGQAHFNVVTYNGRGGKFTSPNLQFSYVNAAARPSSTIAIPSSIPADCSRDVTTDLRNYVNFFGDNHVFSFAANGCYVVNGLLDFDGKHDITFEGNGATIKIATNGSEFCPPPTDPNNPSCSKSVNPERSRHLWQFLNSRNITFHNLIVRGPNPCIGSDACAYDANREAQHFWIIGSGSNNVVLDNVQGYRALGDFVFVSGANNVAIKNSNFDSDGRMALTTNSGNTIVYDHNTVSNPRRSTWDIEPTSFSGPPVDVKNITYSNNTISAGYPGFFFISDTGGQQNADNILIYNNHLRGKDLSFHEANDNQGWPIRKNFRIIGNSSDTAFDGSGPGSPIFIQRANGVEVRDNTYAVTPGRNLQSVTIDDTTNTWITGNSVDGATHSLFVYNFSDSVGPSSKFCISNNKIGSPPSLEGSIVPCTTPFQFQ